VQVKFVQSIGFRRTSFTDSFQGRFGFFLGLGGWLMGSVNDVLAKLMYFGQNIGSFLPAMEDDVD